MNLICKIAPMKKQVYSITLVITVCLSAFSGCFGFGENEQTNPPILVDPEQVRFLGSWHNEANGNEHWIFYSNWTQKYTTVVTDKSPTEPFTTELQFTYTFNESTFCQSILIGGDAPPDCFLYEFSSNDHVLTLYNNGEVMVVLRKD